MGMMTCEGIIKEALAKPENERARIAETLISSLHDIPTREIEEAWQREVAQRLNEIESGTVECLSWEEIRSRLARNEHA